MNSDKIQEYAFSMLIIQVAFVLIGLTGVFPFSLEIAGFDVYGDIQDSVNSIQTMYEGVAGEGIISSVMITGFILLIGVKILLEFVFLCLVGAYPLMIALGLPAVFAVPIAGFLSAVIVYMITIKFLGR
ncbi:MAG: hypothetical protein Q8910_02500 [Bacteroidota bacterium]|nr:hypothetical protein [Bacteroidota bacterium]